MKKTLQKLLQFRHSLWTAATAQLQQVHQQQALALQRLTYLRELKNHNSAAFLQHREYLYQQTLAQIQVLQTRELALQQEVKEKALQYKQAEILQNRLQKRYEQQVMQAEQRALEDWLRTRGEVPS